MLEPICENVTSTEDYDKKKYIYIYIYITFYKLSLVIRYRMLSKICIIWANRVQWNSGSAGACSLKQK